MKSVVITVGEDEDNLITASIQLGGKYIVPCLPPPHGLPLIEEVITIEAIRFVEGLMDRIAMAERLAAKAVEEAKNSQS